MRRGLHFLLDILQSAELIITCTKQYSEAEFGDNVQLQDAVIRRMLVIAEAAKRVSDNTRQALPTIAWPEINGMRNRLVHGYNNIDLSVVWNVIQSEIPPLIAELRLHIPPEK